mmetsp:Transcript_9652/g.14684  ORF Transcript_9652/g.14684 Transcript_9652/m.14684 type:complete len:92 (-) Transcript_9652:609-884(-)
MRDETGPSPDRLRVIKQQAYHIWHHLNNLSNPQSPQSLQSIKQILKGTEEVPPYPIDFPVTDTLKQSPLVYACQVCKYYVPGRPDNQQSPA